MAEIRETQVDRDSDGRVTGYTERVEERPRRKSGGGFGWGLLFGVVIITAAIIFFAYNSGSFQSAGARADNAAAQAETQLGQATENAGDAIEQAGDTIEQTTDQAAQ